MTYLIKQKKRIVPVECLVLEKPCSETNWETLETIAGKEERKIAHPSFGAPENVKYSHI